ncbi:MULTISPECIES: glycosyltransferase family 2 protein [unclassified Desulfovibrio]|uniref:glycosyltransferase family 2 protein n=1 Tax=unclassified Desulfovibrio TaxID=2593640 RepID=UPI0013EAE087|nr:MULTISPECIES: glycosyltransferase family 2 protein [unclassified Desulfovibrio]
MKLSIILPCYNVGETLRRCLDSILMQRINFSCEIIAVDDGSTDGTPDILREYAGRDARLVVLTNESNLGNALAFKRGAEASRGNYLCVLDGDDYYTVRDKLQRQADFLDGDTEGNYAAVSHKYLTVLPDGCIESDPRLFAPACEHTYFEFLKHSFYCHTSTMMYRNVFKNREIPILQTQRGDTIRTLIAMNATCGRVKVLDFVGSVYTLNPKGIWSSLDAEEKKKLDIATWKSCLRHVESQREKAIIGEVVKCLERQQAAAETKKTAWPVPALLAHLATGWANILAFRERDLAFRKLYTSDFIDSFCESLGFITKTRLEIAPAAKPDAKHVAFVISALNKTGGGVYQEILELVTMLGGRKIALFLTDMTGMEEFTEAMKEDWGAFRDVTFTFLKNIPAPLPALMERIAAFNPGKIYWYCGHNNTLADAALQDYGAKNIVPFSFDHGFSLGLSNTNIDLFIAKTPKDYKLLSERFGDRVIYIPCWSVAPKTTINYAPLGGHEKLTTATAAARFYKYEGDILGNFVHFILCLLQATGGKHIHYGPLPEEIRQRLARAMKRNGVAEHRFCHVEWANNLPDSMLSREVDLFISPFPISSIKLNLQCMAAGIPMLVYAGGLTRIEQNDFLYPEVLKWRTRKEFFDIVTSLTREKLAALSATGVQYFKTHNDLSAALPYVLFDRCREAVPIPPPFIDNHIIDINEVRELMGLSSP